jgi:hypothetical protein
MRVTLEAQLGKIRIPLQVDIRFGDAVTPEAQQKSFQRSWILPRPFFWPIRGKLLSQRNSKQS